jgi:hypothetical protein
MIKLRLAALFAMLAVVATNAPATPGVASTPSSSRVSVPSKAGSEVSVTWKGTIPPDVNPTSDCSGDAAADSHTVKVSVPPGIYSKLVAEFTFSITWDPVTGSTSGAGNDEILTVQHASGKTVASSDGGSNVEAVTSNDLPADSYVALACGFNNETLQDYTGKLTITTLGFEHGLPAAPARGLRFSASTAADLQRDESEPLITIDKAGNAYTCGPTGFSNAADYAQVSTDGGKQFHLLGEPPRGQQAAGGGGDCATAESPVKNSEKHYNYSYAGLGPLTHFATATSSNNGRDLQTSPHNGSPPGVDRQWEIFLDRDTVLLNYHRVNTGTIEVIKSDDGGLTFDPSTATDATPTADEGGPLVYLPAKFNPAGQSKGPVAVLPWTSSDAKGNYLDLAVSTDGGSTWKNCLAAKTPHAAGTFFPVADADRAGNIYIAYTLRDVYRTYMVSLRAGRLGACKEGTGSLPKSNPGFSRQVRVDRGKVRTTVFPWIAAGGAPGRVAVTFYGTPSNGDSNLGTFKASWFVYINQSLNALSAHPTFSQVRAITHPFHYDSICLRGLSCDLATPPGDRSLADFFAIDYNRKSRRLMVVFNRANKKPGEALGHIATPLVVTQIGGPSNDGGTIKRTQRVVRTRTTDATGDALADYSSLEAPAANPVEDKAMDFLSVAVRREIDPKTGKLVKQGGFTVGMKIADLSDVALAKALADTGSQSLLWIFRFTNGYRDVAASARYNPGDGFTFGYNGYETNSGQCGSSGDKCLVFPGELPIKGKVDQKKGRIVLSVPRKYLKGLIGPTGPNERPTETKAHVGTRFYDASAFSVGNPYSATQEKDTQSFLYPLDNTAGMDFLLPGRRHCPGFPNSKLHQVIGSSGSEALEGTARADLICGLGGNDTLDGRGGDDVLIGGPGRDFLYGGGGTDKLIGGPRADRLIGGRGGDRLLGRIGADRLKGGPGADRMFGGNGRDVLLGRDHVKGNDLVHGGHQRDRCTVDPGDARTSCRLIRS